MKKSGTTYFASDGSTSRWFENVLRGIGDCVVFKYGAYGDLHKAPCEQSAYFVCENE